MLRLSVQYAYLFIYLLNHYSFIYLLDIFYLQLLLVRISACFVKFVCLNAVVEILKIHCLDAPLESDIIIISA